MRNHPIQNSEQNVLNKAMDNEFDALVVSTGQFDGTNLQREQSSLVNLKVVTVGSVTYICSAPPGTAESASVWQCKKIDESVEGTTTIKWADGNANFDNAATDPTALTYS